MKFGFVSSEYVERFNRNQVTMICNDINTLKYQRKKAVALIFSCPRCYAHALKLMPEVASLWYDLGLNYYHQATNSPRSTDEHQNSLNLEKAQQVIKKIFFFLFQGLIITTLSLYFIFATSA